MGQAICLIVAASKSTQVFLPSAQLQSVTGSVTRIGTIFDCLFVSLLDYIIQVFLLLYRCKLCVGVFVIRFLWVSFTSRIHFMRKVLCFSHMVVVTLIFHWEWYLYVSKY